MMFMFFGEIANGFTDYLNVYLPSTEEERVDILKKEMIVFAWKICILGIVYFVTNYIYTVCLNYAAERQVARIRKRFLESLLRQEIGWYDVNTTTDFAGSMVEDLNRLQDGIGEKFGMIVRFFATFIASFVVAFWYNWKLAAILSGVIPVIAALGIIFGKVITSFSNSEMKSYGKAGSLAEEVLSLIRTVVAFGGQDKEIKQYTKHIGYARQQSIKRSIVVNLVMGLMFGLMYAVYGLGFWYGVKNISDEEKSEEVQSCLTQCIMNDSADMNDCFRDCFSSDPGSILTSQFSIMQGGLQIGQSSVFIEAFNTARAAAGKIYYIIERTPVIEPDDAAGSKPDNIVGNIEFKNVRYYFLYNISQ